jgi:hypothetical protein
MAAIAYWWAIPAGATLLALLWAAWTSRPKRVQDPEDSVAGYARFRQALAPGASPGRDERTAPPRR